MLQEWIELSYNYAMGIKDIIDYLGRVAGFLKPSFRDIFNQHGRLKPGLIAHVQILDNHGLGELAKRHPFNQNMFLTADRDKDFPKYLYLVPAKAIYFIICDDEHRIIASATLRPQKERATTLTLSQISVHRAYRNQGYATRILSEIKTYLNQARPDITKLTVSKFKLMGKAFIRPKLIELSSEFKSEIFEEATSPFLRKFFGSRDS